MKLSKRMIPAVLMGAVLCGAAAFHAAPARAEPLSMRSEEAAHPRLVEAIHRLRETLRELEAAPDDFGGNKAAAIRDCRQAIHSLKRALYYRLKMDDAALDRAE